MEEERGGTRRRRGSGSIRREDAFAVYKCVKWGIFVCVLGFFCKRGVRVGVYLGAIHNLFNSQGCLIIWRGVEVGRVGVGKKNLNALRSDRERR